MWIEAVRNITQKKFQRELLRMEDGELVGLEISQKGAMHVLHWLLRNGPIDEERVRAVLGGLERQAKWLTAECRRRKLPFVDHPGGN